MKKLAALFILSVFVLAGCGAYAAKAYEKEYNYQRAHQQSQKGHNELDKQ